MHALFFQASLFCTFQKVFEDPDVTRNPVTKELYRFAKYILSKFFEVAKKNDKVFVELLFWKGCREAYELEEGYHNSYSASNVRGAWTEDEEEELRYIYEENKNVHVEGQDVADIILANLGTTKRNKHQIILALKRLGLIQSAKDLKPHLRAEWTEDEITDLKHLFEDYQNSDDIMGSILSRLSIKRSKRAVIKKMIELNMIQNSKEVRKKSKRTKKKNNSESESSSDSDDQEDRVQNAGNDQQSSEDEESFFERLRTERLESKKDIDSSNNEVLSSGNMTVSENGTHQKELKPWDEKEIVELSHLFFQHKDADDVLNVILGSLTIKRSKKSVIDKLLEVGLIKDKNEVKQKTILMGEHDESDISELELEETAPVSPSIIEGKSKKKRNVILSDSSGEDEENHVKGDIESELSFSNTKNKFKKTTNDSKEQSKKGMPKVWDEAEIIELHQLYSENKDSDDVIGTIIKGLSIKRSKENIIEKLLVTGLIKDRKEVRKKRGKKHLNNNNKSDSEDETPLKSLLKKNNSNSSKKRPPKIWDEQEIVELQLLFQEHRGSDDVMGALLTNLNVKRSKESIIEKLLELSLIQDRKEIRKKRTSKSNKEQGNKNTSFNSVKSKYSQKEIPEMGISDASDDEEMLPLKTVSNNNSLLSELSDDESTLKLKKPKFYTKSRKNFKVSSDSSDEDALQIDLSVSNEKENDEIKEVANDPFESLLQQTKESTVLSSRTVNSHENLHVSRNGSGLKRKRLMIQDSDDSSNEASVTNMNSSVNGHHASSLSPQRDDLAADPETEINVQQKKKRVKVLIDSDESD